MSHFLESSTRITRNTFKCQNIYEASLEVKMSRKIRRKIEFSSVLERVLPYLNSFVWNLFSNEH